MTYKTIFFLCAGLLISCQRENQTSEPLLDRIAQQPAREMLNRALGQFYAAGGFQAVTGGQFGKYLSRSLSIGARSFSKAGQDTSYYDATSGFWVYSSSNDFYSVETRYRFTPRDSAGIPTAETDSMEFTMTTSGHYGDEEITDRYEFSSDVTYTISGLRDWADPERIGEMVYNGASHWTHREKFTADTMVYYEYESEDRDVRMKENGCSPTAGTMTFTMLQDATPDYFTRDFNIAMGIVCDTTTGCLENGSYRVEFEDLAMHGQVIFEPDGIRFILNGEEFFYEVDCDNFELRLQL
jgi:hypothetical protein